MTPPRGSAARGAAFAALACVTVVVLAIAIGAGDGGESYAAEFTDVRGLVDGAQVRLAGVDVGEVTGIRLGNDGWPRVSFDVGDGVSLRASATAAVRLGSLSGEYNRYVSIVQGSGPPLRSGALIPRSRTISPVELDNAIATFDPAARSSIRTILAGLRTSLRGEGSPLAATLASSQAALSQVAGAAGEIGDDGAALSDAVSSSQKIAATLAGRSGTLETAVDRSTTLLATLATHADQLSGALAGLPAGLDATTGALTRARALVAPATGLLTAASPVIAQLPQIASELRAALVAARPALAQAASVTRVAPAAATALTPLLRAAGPLLAVMNPVLKRIGPMLDQLRVRFPDAFSFFANWADFTSNYDANGHAARVGIVLPPASTNVLSPSSDGAGQLAPPYLRTPGAMDGQPWTDYWKSFVDGGTAGPDVSGSGK
jgi:phospholipid/cholesterol/gamma-HCH transport system substrate-binding protein